MKQKTIKLILSTVSNLWVQITAIIFAIAAFSFIGYQFTTYFSAIEKDPAITYLYPKQADILGDRAAAVQVGFQITHFWTFDVQKNSFAADAIVWFKFDPRNVSIDLIDKFEIENTEIKERSGPFMRMAGDALFAYYYLNIEFKSLLDYRNFPFDDHRIFIIISNKEVSNEFLYVTDKELFTQPKKYLYLQDYEPINHDARFGLQINSLHEWDVKKEVSHPSVVFSLDFKKKGLGKMLNFGPMFLMFFIGLFSLVISIKADNIVIPLSLGTLSAIVLYRFVLQNALPEAASLTTADEIYMLFLALSFVVALINITALAYLHKKPEGLARANITRNIFLLAIILIVIVTMLQLLPPEV